ncbi:unnamed protein product [Brassica oleracea var. botrytis]|nr:unnamed protein product [Brassica napus]
MKERPKWMKISSLDELKSKAGHVIVMILLVKMFQRSKMVTIATGLDLLCKNGWRVEQSHNRGGGGCRGGGRGGGDGGRGRGGSDFKCYECGESGHFACECRSCGGGGGGGSRRGRSPSPRGRSRSRSPPRYRKSPTYGGRRFFVI